MLNPGCVCCSALLGPLLRVLIQPVTCSRQRPGKTCRSLRMPRLQLLPLLGEGLVKFKLRTPSLSISHCRLSCSELFPVASFSLPPLPLNLSLFYPDSMGGTLMQHSVMSLKRGSLQSPGHAATQQGGTWASGFSLME